MTHNYCDVMVRTICSGDDNDFNTTTTSSLLISHFHSISSISLSKLLYKYEHLQNLLNSQSPLKFIKENPLPDPNCALICYKLINKSGNYLKFTSDECRNNSDMVFRALENTPSAIAFVGNDLRRDFNFAKKILTQLKQNAKNCMFQYLEEFHDNDELASIAIETHKKSYQFLSTRLKKERKFIEEAIDQNGLMLEFVPKSLISRELIMRAIKSTIKKERELIYQFLPKEFEKDNEIILEIAKSMEEPLKLFPTELLQD